MCLGNVNPMRQHILSSFVNRLALALVLMAFQFTVQLSAAEPKPLELHIVETDSITPVEILHNVEEIFIDGRLEQHYNYYIYRFEKYGAFLHARTYYDNNSVVSVYGPFSDRGSLKKTKAPKLYNEVLDYLKRRFMVIDILGTEGYVTIWKQPDFE